MKNFKKGLSNSDFINFGYFCWRVLRIMRQILWRLLANLKKKTNLYLSTVLDLCLLSLAKYYTKQNVPNMLKDCVKPILLIDLSIFKIIV